MQLKWGQWHEQEHNQCGTKTTHAKKTELEVQLQRWSVKKHKEKMYSTNFLANQ